MFQQSEARWLELIIRVQIIEVLGDFLEVRR
jgi:hypothetical protein